MALPAGQIVFTLEYAQGLKDMDWIGKQDPYATVTCGVQHFRSRTHTDGGRNPVWNQTFIFNVINENTVQVELWDADVMSRDDKIGTCTVDLSKARMSGMDQQQVAVRTTRGRQQGFVSVKLAFTPNQALTTGAYAAPHAPYPATAPLPYPGGGGGYTPAPPVAHQPSMYHHAPAPAAAPYPGTGYAPAQPVAQYPAAPYGAAAPPAAYTAPPPAASGYYPAVPGSQQYVPGPPVPVGPPPPMRLY